MKRLFGWSTLLTLAMATTVYLAARHASRHPDSFIARCTGSVFQCGCCEADACDEQCEPEEPQPIDESAPPDSESVANSELIEPLDVSCNAPTTPPPQLPAALVQELGRVEVEGEPVRIMPHCGDDDAETEFMPYADEESAPRQSKDSGSQWTLEMGLLGVTLGLDVKTDNGGAELLRAPKCSECSKCCGSACPQKACGPRNSKLASESEAGAEEQEAGVNDVRPVLPARPPSGGKPSGLLLKPVKSEDDARKPKVDTMEFRPTDARRGEFGPIPF
jgi:hypothetical protein